MNNAISWRVLVVDDYEPWRRTLCSILQKHPILQVVGEAQHGFEAVQKATELKPDLVLLDITMPVLNGMGLLERMLADPNLKDIPVVLVTASSYSKEQIHESQFTVHQQTGLYPTEVLQFLSATVNVLKPRYYASAKEV